MGITIRLLLDEVARGNHAAFEKLYNTYFKKCFSLALYYVKSKEIAEDVIAEVFYMIWKSRDLMLNVKDWNSYLYISIRNQAFLYLEQTKRIPFEPSDLFSIHFISHDNNPEELLLKQEFDTVLNKALSELPERCKMIYYMVREEKMSYRQIAESLDISERTVNSQMTIAVKKLGMSIKSYLEVENK